MHLENGYGFALPADREAFVPTPDIVIQRSITGALAIDDRYRLDIEASIVDAGLGIGDPPTGAFAIAAATNPATAWGAPLAFQGVTCFGPVRASEVGGAGGIFVHRFEVLGQPARLHQVELVFRRRRPAAAEPFLRARARCAARVHVRMVQRPGLRATC